MGPNRLLLDRIACLLATTGAARTLWTMSIEVNPDEDFHVVINGNVLALSLDALSAAYEGEVIVDETAIWQPGLGEWMRLDTVLYHLEQQEPAQPSPEVAEDSYYVQLAPDDVKLMSLDQLDTAYRLDIVEDSTLVWQPGYAEWVPLAVLLGEDTAQDHYSLAPSLPAPLPAPAPLQSNYAAQSNYPAQSGFAPSVPAQPSYAAAPSYAPAAAPSFIPFPSSPAPSVAPRSGPSAVPNSLSAVASNYSYIPELPEPPAKASPWYARTLIAAAALMALGVAHRHGAGYELATSMDGASSDKAWAGRVGEPAADTPYGLERWLGQIEKTYALDQLSATEAVPGTTSLSTSSSSSASASSSSASTNSEQTQPTAQPPSASAPGATTDTKSASSSGASAFGAALSNQPAPAKAKSQASTRKYAPAAKSKKSATMKGGNAYDPMNGAL